MEFVCSVCHEKDKPMTIVNATITCVPCLDKLTAEFQAKFAENIKDTATAQAKKYEIKEDDVYR